MGPDLFLLLPTWVPLAIVAGAAIWAALAVFGSEW